MNVIELLKKWWAQSSPFRHGVTAWLSIQIAVPLAQVAAWAQTHAAHSAHPAPLPDWHMVGMDLIYGSIAALIAAYFKWKQNKRAFPDLTKPK